MGGFFIGYLFYMESKTIYEELWEKGIQPEVIDFLHGLNWTFILMFIIILYGLKHTNHFNWFDTQLDKIKSKEYKVWIAALITGLVFCFFKWKENDGLFGWAYASMLLRSIFFGVIFSSIFVDIPVFIIQKLGSIIDKKEPAAAPKKRISKN